MFEIATKEKKDQLAYEEITEASNGDDLKNRVKDYFVANSEYFGEQLDIAIRHWGSKRNVGRALGISEFIIANSTNKVINGSLAFGFPVYKFGALCSDLLQISAHEFIWDEPLPIELPLLMDLAARILIKMPKSELDGLYRRLEELAEVEREKARTDGAGFSGPAEFIEFVRMRSRIICQDAGANHEERNSRAFPHIRFQSNLEKFYATDKNRMNFDNVVSHAVRLGVSEDFIFCKNYIACNDIKLRSGEILEKGPVTEILEMLEEIKEEDKKRFINEIVCTYL